MQNVFFKLLIVKYIKKTLKRKSLNSTNHFKYFFYILAFNSFQKIHNGNEIKLAKQIIALIASIFCMFLKGYTRVN